MNKKYARLLVDYCLDIKKGDKLYISTTTAAIPLVKEIYRYALSKDCVVEYDLSFDGQNGIFMSESGESALNHMPILKEKALKHFDAYLAIKAPFNLRDGSPDFKDKMRTRRDTLKPLNDIYFTRTGNGQFYITSIHECIGAHNIS